MRWCRLRVWLGVLFSGVTVGVVGCASPSVSVSPVTEIAKPVATQLPSPDVWGGEARCDKGSCRWIGVEHELNQVVLYRIDGRRATLLDKAPVGYHPDSARWINERLVVAAVEATQSLDIFAVGDDGKLRSIDQIPVGFAPRDVWVWPVSEGGWLLLATPYLGTQVTWAHWREGDAAKTVSQTWCDTPWHVFQTIHPKGGQAGLLTACRRDRRVVWLPQPSSWQAVPDTHPRVAQVFDDVPRRVQASPSGRYWYVALELGGRVARYDTVRDVWQWMPFPEVGAVGIAALTDDTVAWGENQRVLIVSYDEEGKIRAERSIKTSGSPKGLQWIDLDGDGAEDLIVMNSSGPAVDIFWGPLLP